MTSEKMEAALRKAVAEMQVNWDLERRAQRERHAAIDRELRREAIVLIAAWVLMMAVGGWAVWAKW